MTTVDLAGRDRQIVQLIARFKQATSKQIHELLFSANASRTPADVALKRLTTRGYLHRIERRTVGGSRGGSGLYVYALGRRGFFMFFEGRYSPARSVNYHALAILDSYIVLRRLEVAGRLSIVGLSTEPDCWVKVGGNQLMPDMYSELDPGNGQRWRINYEIDMATEGQRQIREKLERYWRAYNEADTEVFPLVLWVAVDDERAKELLWIVGQQPEDARLLFQVTTLEKLPAVFGG
jgi:hypothetical protein